MDASDAVYYPFPNDGHDPGNGPRHCSVRGCTQFVPDGSPNKMCDTCRGRHRIYASTKRARRKFEKAAIAARNGQEPVDPASNGMSSPVVTASSWMTKNTDFFHERMAPSDSHSSVPAPSSSISPSMLSTSWNQSIDPRLFAEDARTSPSRHLPIHQTSSSSELANALTLPPPRPQIQAESTSDANYLLEEQTEEGKEIQSTPASSDAAPQDSNEGPTRLCSVKGCKSALPPSYEFKMCPPCRTRYRSYGNTKRAKWKTEREAFDREMAALRAFEDKRRELEGLPPLADNPDELRAWELSIIDEQVPQANEGVSHNAPVAGTPQQSASEPLFSVNYTSPMVIASVYPATIGSIDTPHSVSPYPHLNDPSNMSRPGPLPARMCTVSHCHKILPGYYCYKRCEQHRLQNRHHSKLKRVREKGDKVVDSSEGASTMEGVSIASIVPSEADEGVTSEDDVKSSTPGTDEKGKGKTIEHSSFITVAAVTPEGPSLGTTSTMQLWPNNITIPNPDINRKGPEPKSRAQMNQLSKFACVTDDCENLLIPGIRWRTCEECQDRDRLRKFAVRAELKAAENAYWKGVAQTLSAARKANEMAAASGTTPQAATSSQNEAPAVLPPPDGSEDDDADGDSDIADGEEETPVTAFTLVYDSKSASANTPPVSSSIAPVTPPPITALTTSSIIPIPVSVSTTTLPEDLSTVATLTPASPIAENSSTDNTNTTRTYYRKERMEMQPPMHLSPTFNTIIKQKQQRVQADAAPVVNGQFSKFRVQLVPGSSAPPTQTMIPMWDIQPPPPASTEEARTPVDVPLATTEASMTNEDTSADSNKVGTAGQVTKAIPTLTIPTSAPFVYNPPVKKPIKDVKTTVSNGKGKKKSVLKQARSSAGLPTVATPTNSTSAPSGTFGPLGLPPSYPYYPYYMPSYPYPHLPPVHPPASNNQAYPQPVASSSSATVPGAPKFFPYPYPPQPFGLGSPLGAYPYLPPRYTLTGQNSISGQQPYLAFPPAAVAYKGYPFFVPPARVSSSAPLPTTAGVATETMVLTPQDPQQKPPSPKPAVNPPESEVATLTYHHLGTESFATAIDKPTRKRRKVDPDYLEKHKALQADRLALMANPGAHVNPVLLPTTPSGDVSESLPAEVVERATDSESEPNGGQSNAVDLRPCTTKTCRRTLPPETVGKICEKCKLRIRKHQAKTKRRFRLEPRKLLAKDVTEKQNHTEALTNGTVQDPSF